ncbi:HrcA family transcriptional regulator [Gordoniibacillus kamchatkensis]|uniref:Heat-inducible transcription repressor HrcA n=1 Tax=Gordoniibacillus kamchatkensis TaxID=1590651 RepID=A0ABR5AB43_9BACL|nr:heat-inducible transcriptional repressor HrcA [Paenibacillus sp. VKM B-2647]KIL38279.1 HrcA family transcriptional regulator [Paenibacillus sp. VKM B-2647]
MLSERQRMILSAIVDDYIRSAEPIGSRSISKRGNVGFSPATIRNEMSDLEEMGFLEQPHTSAGRIPSQKGYRYYVDHLIQHGTLTPHELNVIKLFFAEKIDRMEQVIQHVASVLSSLTNYTSIVVGPEVLSTTLKHIQLVPLNESQAVAIIVTNTGQVENKTFTIPEGLSMAELEKVVNILNARLQGVPLLQFRTKLFSEVASELSRYASGHDKLLRELEKVVNKDEENRIFLSGTTNMLTQPEFRDVDKVKSLLDLLEAPPSLIRLVASSHQGGIQVRIGSENSMEAVNDCSLITATYSIGDQFLGTIGVLGPTRMEYAKVMSLLDHVSKNLAVVLGRWYG